jgi:hypothetical protein
MSLSAAGRDDAEFSSNIYSCRLRTEDWDKTTLIPSFVVMVAPTLIVIGTTIPTLKYLATARLLARRVRGIDPWRGAVTATLTALFYLIAVTPLFACYIVKHFAPSVSNHFRFYRIAIFLLPINIISNFYIYALTIKSFRRFLLFKVMPARLRRVTNTAGK